MAGPSPASWNEPPIAPLLSPYREDKSKRLHSREGSRSSGKSQSFLASLERLNSQSNWSMGSMKKKQAMLVSRMTPSRGTRRSRASTESRGPFSSKEDFDVDDIDDVDDLELPPNILADNWGSSAPSFGSEQRPRRRGSKKPKKRVAKKEQKKRGFRARLRRLLGRDKKKSKGGHESPYSHRETRQNTQSEDSGLSDQQDATAERNPQPRKAGLSPPIENTPRSSCRNILRTTRDAFAQNRAEAKEEPTDRPKEAVKPMDDGHTTKQ
ncbi:hypothetical protein CPAR01_10317 [Colletotrichum paranaense]|uniref:Uncharacterized protein n=1 Tax=Colletotrichum paranaense TaxID=1914294 RepID=A0ABQ9SDM9_9PEZI|nr:uncharacterized protein CPAR01_10317 [Colletotrichum paranaense]KAK1533609.1 hypothetical protein CPAR01_10317 [Colletotrichum paranaense]